MRVVVVGANGGIGRALSDILHNSDHDVADLRDRRERWCGPDPDAIIFAQGSHTDPMEDNVDRMFDVIDAAFNPAACRFIVTMCGGGVGGPSLTEPGDYTASKAAVAVWTEWAAARHPKTHFFCVAPGLTATKMTGYKGADPRIPAAFIVKLLSGKYGHLSGSLLAAQRDDLDTMKPMKLRRVECP
jgi:NAD(P)-dependent dehydrogenase (short-subunit alcohol dehydrogenase family)